MTAALEAAIEAAWNERESITPASTEVRSTVDAVLAMLDSGEVRVAEKIDGAWQVQQWLKKAVLLSFRLNDNAVIEHAAGGAPAFDKVPSKFAGWEANRFRDAGFRVVPGAVARRGAYIAKGVVLMPSFVNIGAFIDTGTMVDTWATVGSCERDDRCFFQYITNIFSGSGHFCQVRIIGTDFRFLNRISRLILKKLF